MKKSFITLTTAALMAVSMSMISWAMTADGVTAKNPTSYTAGTQSIYGSALNQEQLNAVAQATADFMTANITDSMSTDDKIKAAYNYIKDRTTYVDWNAATGANTAYTLVTGQGACSGMCRSMKALCDAMEIECYHVHSTSDSHQWNLVRYGDGVLYHVDIDANKSAGQDIIYKSLTHPLPFDTSAYPAVGQVQEQTANNGWQQENGKWYYYENGSKATNKWINGTYYVGSDGTMLTNTTTPDGYQVGADGAWTQAGTQSGNIGGNDGVHTKNMNDTTANMDININIIEERTDTSGNFYVLVSEDTTTVSFTGNLSDINPQNLKVSMAVYKYNPDTNTIYAFSNDGTAVWLPFEYDKVYDIQIANVNLKGKELVNYCKNNNLAIAINATDITTNEGRGFIICYK